MTIELEIETVRAAIRKAIRPNINIWCTGQFDRGMLADSLSDLIAEMLYATAAMTKTRGAEKAIVSAIKLAQGWPCD